MKKLSLFIFASAFLFHATVGFAQEKEKEQYIDAARKILIETNNTAILFAPDQDNRLQQIYYGSKEKTPSDLQHLGEAYTSGGSDFYYTPALRVVHSDGNTSTLLKLEKSESKKVDDNLTVTKIYLKDDYYPFYVTLVFKAYQKENVIAQSVLITNKEDKMVTVYNFASSSLSFKKDKYYLTQFHGEWADEMNMVEEELRPGIKIIDSKLGVRAHEMRNPSFLLAIGAPAKEDSGEVIGATFAWSGSFSFSFEIDEKGRLYALSGMNPFAAQRLVAPGESFELPEMLTIYSNNGTGSMSRDFQMWGRKYGMRGGFQEHTILLNNWEATFFDFDEQKLISLFKGAKELGFELFLLDDGWFGTKYPRNNDHTSLGDWDVNPKKLPNGIKALTDAADNIGIDFGIWVEPEMTNPKSELYEKHPDWVIAQKHRPLHFRRNQLNLDLSNPEVAEFSFQVVDKILTQNPDIKFIKWDANRFVTNGGSFYLKPEFQSHLIYDYHQALYKLMQKVVDRHPNVRMMLCSGGGGRVDYKSLSYFTEYWPSDNTDPLKRVYIQWGYSQFFPAIATAGHVTHWGARPIKFCFDVAMSVRMGMDRDLAKLSKEELEFSKNAIIEYKRIRPIVQFGTQYRLVSPYENPHSATMYVNDNKSKAVVFLYQVKDVDFGEKTIALKGLDSGKKYSVREINRWPDATGNTTMNIGTFSGKQLMEGALNSSLNKQLTSSVFELTAE